MRALCRVKQASIEKEQQSILARIERAESRKRQGNMPSPPSERAEPIESTKQPTVSFGKARPGGVGLAFTFSHLCNVRAITPECFQLQQIELDHHGELRRDRVLQGPVVHYHPPNQNVWHNMQPVNQPSMHGAAKTPATPVVESQSLLRQGATTTALPHNRPTSKSPISGVQIPPVCAESWWPGDPREHQGVPFYTSTSPQALKLRPSIRLPPQPSLGPKTDVYMLATRASYQKDSRQAVDGVIREKVKRVSIAADRT